MVLSDGSPIAQPKPGRLTPPTGTYLIQIDPRTSSVGDLAESMQRLPVLGAYRFSSLSAARLVALVARELGTLDISLNISLKPSVATPWVPQPVIEGTLMGAPFDYGNQWYTTTLLNVPGTATYNPRNANGLGIGVVSAWDYLSYKLFNVPFYHRPIVAIIDGGFALDTTTGAPLNGNPDFEEGATPFQLAEDFNDPGTNRFNAGGPGKARCSISDACPWHGTGVFSTAAAVPYNSFGSAGTGSQRVKPYLIKANSMHGFEVAQGVSDAALLDPPADVINISAGSALPGCNEFCGFFYDGVFTQLTQAIAFARGYSLSIIVASAGNDSDDDSSPLDNIPCTADGVLCVGAVDSTARPRLYASGSISGHGKRVSIWAPDCIITTPDPSTWPNIDPQGFCGTSAASPFVAGIVSLMKALNPGLSYDDVRAIVQQTALPGQSPLVTPGYIDALGSLMAVSPNQPPTIQITSPSDGSQLLPRSGIDLISSVTDPEVGTDFSQFPVRVLWTSSLQGTLCSGIRCTPPTLRPGTHVITATITDAFGATSSATVTVTVTASAPRVTITYPPANKLFYTSQQAEFRGYALDDFDGQLAGTRLVWSSSIDGQLNATGSNGSDIFAKLSAGTHTITLTATDLFGLTGSASVVVQVQVGADFPTVAITSPPDNFFIGPDGTSQTFVGTATDPIDASFPASAYVWTDSVDGPLGTGPTITKVLSGVFGVPVFHTVKLTVTNAAGNSAETEITVTIGLIY